MLDFGSDFVHGQLLGHSARGVVGYGGPPGGLALPRGSCGDSPQVRSDESEAMVEGSVAPRSSGEQCVTSQGGDVARQAEVPARAVGGHAAGRAFGTSCEKAIFVGNGVGDDSAATGLGVGADVAQGSGAHRVVAEGKLGVEADDFSVEGYPSDSAC